MVAPFSPAWEVRYRWAMSGQIALAVTAILALTVASSCGGDGESSSSEPAAVATTEVVVTEPAVTEPAVTEPAVTEPAVTEPATTDAPDSSEPASSEPDVPPVGGMEVDDDPVCQAFSRLLAASLYSGLAGAFGADDGTVEKVELFFAPALAPVAVVIRTQGPAEFQVYPSVARVDAGNAALMAAGFTDEELVALAASGDDIIDGILDGSGLGGLEDVGTVPGAETKLAAAAEAFLADVGTIDESFEASADGEAAFLEEFGTLCPMLLASLESL